MLNTDSYAKSMDLAERVSQLEAKMEAAEKVIQDLYESVMFLKMIPEEGVEVIDGREYLD